MTPLPSRKEKLRTAPPSSHLLPELLNFLMRSTAAGQIIARAAIAMIGALPCAFPRVRHRTEVIARRSIEFLSRKLRRISLALGASNALTRPVKVDQKQMPDRRLHPLS